MVAMAAAKSPLASEIYHSVRLDPILDIILCKFCRVIKWTHTLVRSHTISQKTQINPSPISIIPLYTSALGDRWQTLIYICFPEAIENGCLTVCVCAVVVVRSIIFIDVFSQQIIYWLHRHIQSRKKRLSTYEFDWF